MARRKNPSSTADIVVTSDTSLDPFADEPSQDLVKATNRREALRLHKAGVDYAGIAEQLGIRASVAKTLVREAVKMLTAEVNESTLEEHKAVALMQLNDLYVVAAKERELYLDESTRFRESEGRDGKIPSVDVLVDLQEHMLRIHGAKTKLLGLNAATKIEAKGAFFGIDDLQKFQDAMDANSAPVTVNPDGTPCLPPKN